MNRSFILQPIIRLINTSGVIEDSTLETRRLLRSLAFNRANTVICTYIVSVPRGPKRETEIKNYYYLTMSI